MSWKLLVVMVCLTAHSGQALDVDLVADMFSLVGVILDLLSSMGANGSTESATSSGRAECSEPENATEVCDYYKQTEACNKLGIFKKSGTKAELNSYCATECTKFKNEVYKNGNGDYRALCNRTFDTCYCQARN